MSLTLTRTGLSLKEVKRYIDLYQQGDVTLPERYEIMCTQREKTAAEMSALKRRLEVLDNKIAHYSKLLQGVDDDWNHEYMQDIIWKGQRDER